MIDWDKLHKMMDESAMAMLPRDIAEMFMDQIEQLGDSMDDRRAATAGGEDHALLHALIDKFTGRYEWGSGAEKAVPRSQETRRSLGIWRTIARGSVARYGGLSTPWGAEIWLPDREYKVLGVPVLTRLALHIYVSSPARSVVWPWASQWRLFGVRIREVDRTPRRTRGIHTFS